MPSGVKIYYQTEKQKHSTNITTAQLVGLIQDGTVQPCTKVWKSGMSTWEPLSQVQSQLDLSVGQALSIAVRSSPVLSTTLSGSTTPQRTPIVVTHLYHEVSSGVSSKKLSAAEAQQAISNGTIKPETKVWSKELHANRMSWTPYRDICDVLMFETSVIPQIKKSSLSPSPTGPAKPPSSSPKQVSTPVNDEMVTEMFESLDKDMSGSIEARELAHICEILKLDTSAVIDKMESGSATIDGRVTLEEFQYWWHHTLPDNVVKKKIMSDVPIGRHLRKLLGVASKSMEPHDLHKIESYLRQVRKDNATVDDPISGLRLDITKQCVNVTISGGARDETHDYKCLFSDLFRVELPVSAVCWVFNPFDNSWLKGKVSSKPTSASHRLILEPEPEVHGDVSPSDASSKTVRVDLASDLTIYARLHSSGWEFQSRIIWKPISNTDTHMTFESRHPRLGIQPKGPSNTVAYLKKDVFDSTIVYIDDEVKSTDREPCKVKLVDLRDINTLSPEEEYHVITAKEVTILRDIPKEARYAHDIDLFNNKLTARWVPDPEMDPRRTNPDAVYRFSDFEYPKKGVWKVFEIEDVEKTLDYLREGDLDKVKATWSKVASSDVATGKSKEIRIDKGPNLVVKGEDIHLQLAITSMQTPRALVGTQPALVTGPAACGKSTLTKQYAFHLCDTVLQREMPHDRHLPIVPLRVTVIELAQTIATLGDAKDNVDILGEHVERNFGGQSKQVALFLMEMRRRRRLVVLLDGIDEAGNARAVLEPYVSGTLAHEVFLCLSGRENGIKGTHLFGDFVRYSLLPLDEGQQRFIANARLEAAAVRAGEITLEGRVDTFMKQVRESFAEVASTPLLLNLLLSEHLRHEKLQSAIHFDGRIVKGQTEYIASFPGVHFIEWGRVTQVLEKKSVACIFIPGNCPLYGQHDQDPTCPGKCYCQTFLYHDAPKKVQRDKLGIIMDEAEIVVDKRATVVGQKVEAHLAFPRLKTVTDEHGHRAAVPYREELWWVCAVVHADATHVGIRPGGYQMEEMGSQDGCELREDADGKAFFLFPRDSPKLNQTGERATSMQVGQAPFGCRWFSRWVAEVRRAEEMGQRAVVVYKKGKTGLRTLDGLGASQLKEVAFLEREYPKYREPGALKEIDAREFEAENALNRAQIYQSATTALIEQKGKMWSDGTTTNVAKDIKRFLEILAHANQTRDGAQFRRFGEAFVKKHVGSSFWPIWVKLRELVFTSQFPLIAREPSKEGEDSFLFVHLSFQEYFCAQHLVRKLRQTSFAACPCLEAFRANALGEAATSCDELLAQDRYQVVVQIMMELLNQHEMAYCRRWFAESLLCVDCECVLAHKGLDTANAIATLTSLLGGARTHVRRLNLSGTDNALNMGALARYNKRWSDVEWINISKTQLGKIKGVRAFANGLSTSNIQSLVIGPGSTELVPAPSMYLRDAQFGPIETIIVAGWLSTPATAAVERVDMLGNPMGDSVDLLIDIFKKTERIRTMCGIEEGTVDLNLSKRNMDPSNVRLLAMELSSTRATAAVTSVDILANPIGDEGFKTIIQLFESTPRLQSMCGVVPGAKEVNFSNRNLKPVDIKIIAHELNSTRATAAVTTVDLSGNGYLVDSGAGDDSDMTGLEALCEALSNGAKIKTLNLSECFLSKSKCYKSISTLSTRVTWSTVAVTSVDLRKNFIAAPISKDGDNLAPWTSYDTDLSGLEALCDALSSSSITSVNLAENVFGPKAVSTLSTRVTWSTAAVESVNILKNPIGDDGLKILMDTFEKAPQLGSICGVKKGQEVLDLSNQSLSPFDMKILAADFAATRATAAVTQVDVSKNQIGDDGKRALATVIPTTNLKQIALDLGSGIVTLTSDTTLDLARKGLKPIDILVVSSWLSTTATAAVTSVDLSGNSISGTTHSKGKGRFGDKVTFDADMSGLELLCKALSSGRITTIKMSNCEFGPKAISTLSTQVTWSTAAEVTSVDLSGNSLTGGYIESYGVQVGDDNSGVTAISDALPKSKIKDLNISNCGIGPSALTVVTSTLSTAAVTSVDLSGNFITGARPVTSREEYKTHGDFMPESEYAGLEQLCKAISSSAIKDLNISNNHLGPKSMSTLSTQVTWSTAAVTSVDLSANPLTGKANMFGKAEVGDDNTGITAISDALPKSKITDLNISNCGIGPSALAIVSSTLSTAAVTSVDLSGNPLTGKVYYGDPVVGDDNTGITAITDALPKSKITDLNISNCGIGPSALKIVSSTLSTAAVTSVDLSDNLISGSKYTHNDKDFGVETFDADVTGIEALAAIKVETLIMRECALGPKAITALSSTLSTAAVTSVDLSGNAISGTTHSEYRGHSKDKVTFDANMSGLELLCKALSSARITTIKMSDCEFGPKAMSTLSTQVTWSTAAVTSVDLSKNFIAAPISKNGNNRAPWTSYDTDLSGLEALCDALSSSGITSVNLAENVFGPKAISTLSTQVTWSTAAVERVDLSNNKFDPSIIDDELKAKVQIKLDKCKP